MNGILSKNKKIMDVLWLAVALSAPLFSVSFLRIDLNLFHLNFHFAVPDVIIFIIFLTGMLSLCFNEGAWAKTTVHKRYGDLMVLTAMFFLWHVLSISRSYDMALAVKNTVRLFFGIIVFWCVLLFFPRDGGFLKKFFNVLSWSMSFVLLYLLYVYAFIFKAPFLSSDLDQEARWSKNQLSYFVARVLPFTFFSFYFSINKFLYLIPVFILAISTIYAASRGGWGALFFGFLSIFGVLLYKQRANGLKSVLKIVTVLFLVFGVSFLILSRMVCMVEISNRFNSIFKPNSTEALYFTRTPVLPENKEEPSLKGEVASSDYPANLPMPSAFPKKSLVPSIKRELPAFKRRVYVSSYEVRGRRVDQALRGFLTSPIIGVGLANAGSFADGLIHNDYAAILLEMGSIGIILFMGILWAVARRLFAGKLLRKKESSWLYLGAVGSWTALLIVSMVYDSYVAAYFWMFLALFVVIAEIEFLEIKGE